jgi:hypothetical protein
MAVMLSDAAAKRIAALVERRVTVSELRDALDRPISEREREDVLDLVRWFCQRYPTPLERLAYVRRAYRRWQRRPGTKAQG